MKLLEFILFSDSCRIKVPQKIYICMFYQIHFFTHYVHISQFLSVVPPPQVFVLFWIIKM